MKRFFAAMILAGLVAVPMTFADDKPAAAPDATKEAPKKAKAKAKGKKAKDAGDKDAPKAAEQK